eukprot:331530-Pelagomonas_calceolata.AAC.4
MEIWWSKSRVHTVANLAGVPKLAVHKPLCYRKQFCYKEPEPENYKSGDTYAGSMQKTPVFLGGGDVQL